jgi:hypothetical protein
LFEEQPWLLIPLVILIVEAWNVTKTVARQWWRRRADRSGDALGPP